jgi:myo-inositol-1(or 4)-monophosphatase
MTPTLPATATDAELLLAVVAAAEAAGAVLVGRSTDRPPLRTPAEVRAAIDANDSAALAVLRPLLAAARPGAREAEDEEAGGALPPGEWWVLDPVEGNINHLHGIPEWGVTVTLVRDDVPVLAVVHLPLAGGGTTYTALAGAGAFRDGERLHVSAKDRLDTALVGTGQAKPGEDAATFRRIGGSMTAMLAAALVVRAWVPATLPLVQVAAGELDAFWQYSDVRSGLLAGALLVTEAGGTVTDTAGRPWTTRSADFLAAAPALHPAAVDVLSAVA